MATAKHVKALVLSDSGKSLKREVETLPSNTRTFQKANQIVKRLNDVSGFPQIQAGKIRLQL